MGGARPQSLIPYNSMALFGVIEDFPEAYQSLDERFVRNRASTFFFESQGTAMEPSIFEGEILIVDRSIRQSEGRVCIVAYQDALLCRRLQKRQGRIWLVPDNPQHKVIEIAHPSELNIWGVVISKASDVL
jgi:DNA polymerase V